MALNKKEIVMKIRFYEAQYVFYSASIDQHNFSNPLFFFFHSVNLPSVFTEHIHS